MRTATRQWLSCQGIDEVNRYTDVISGTNTAFEQAGIIMESYNEKKARVQARFDDFRISVFNATGDFGIWVETVAGSLVPLSQLMPLIMGVGKAMTLVKSINFAGVFSSLSRMVTVARYQLLFMNAELRTGQMVSIGFLGNITRGDRRRRSFCNGGAALGYKGSRGVGSLPCHGRHGVGDVRGHRLGSFRYVQGRGGLGVPGCGYRYYEHPDHRLDCRRNRGTYRIGRLFLEYLGKVPRRA